MFATRMRALPMRYAVEQVCWTSFRIGSFRENITITFQDGNSFWIGVGLNAARPILGRVRLEANPNKCINHQAFLDVLRWLNQHSHPLHTRVKRFDLAVDIPVARENAHLVKDRRTYSEIRKSKENWTEYLGAKSSTDGRVKLYNKTIEANLSYPLTRLELTLDPNVPFSEISWPVVYVVGMVQVNMKEMRLTDTERFVLGALMEGYGHLNELGRKTREKMTRLLSEYVRWINVSEQNYNRVLSNLRNLLYYPEKDLGVTDIDDDQPPTFPSLEPRWVTDGEKALADKTIDMITE